MIIYIYLNSPVTRSLALLARHHNVVAILEKLPIKQKNFLTNRKRALC